MIEQKRKPRTVLQNAALHLFCERLSEALNDAGLDMKATLKPEIEIPWSPDRVKDFLWRPVQEAMTGKHSTTELNTVEPSEIWEVLNRHLAEKFGISVDWPSEESLMWEMEAKRQKRQGQI